MLLPGLDVAGAVFIIFSLAAFVSGLRGLYRQRRARRAYLAGATAPWDWDHPWERVGARDDVWRRALRRFVAAGAGRQHVEVEPDGAAVALAEGVDGVDLADLVGRAPDE